MLRNASVIFKRGTLYDKPFQVGLRSVSTTNVHLKSSSVEATKQKSNNDYFKTMHDNQNLASSAKPPGWDDAKPFAQIPGPKPLPVIGNSWRFVLSEMKGEDLADQMNL